MKRYKIFFIAYTLLTMMIPGITKKWLNIDNTDKTLQLSDRTWIRMPLIDCLHITGFLILCYACTPVAPANAPWY